MSAPAKLFETFDYRVSPTFAVEVNVGRIASIDVYSMAAFGPDGKDVLSAGMLEMCADGSMNLAVSPSTRLPKLAAVATLALLSQGLRLPNDSDRVQVSPMYLDEAAKHPVLSDGALEAWLNLTGFAELGNVWMRPTAGLQDTLEQNGIRAL